MTVFLPLDPTSPVPALPAFISPAHNVPAQLARAIQAIMKAKRIVVICGAGISVQAGIPDFRSSEGLFQTIKRDNPREAMLSGKELFDASVFNSENKTSLFCQMIAQLSDLSQAAQPTAFHHVLRALADRGRLLRVYTQNIDAIEQKCGLSFGVPEFEGRRSKSRSSKGKSKASALVDAIGVSEETTRAHDGGITASVVNATEQEPIASTSRLPSPPVETPRCIPLHGTLQSMHCQVCNNSFPLHNYLPSLVSGQPPPCPECTSLETTRQLVGKRPRGIGKLRPSVVLYNEAHKDGEGVGDVVQKDLIGSSKGKGKSGADLLLVVGTSLKVPGTKRMVREFAKAVKSRGVNSGSSLSKDDSGSSSTPAAGLATPAPSPRRSPAADSSSSDDLPPIPKAVYLNLDFPVPTREWEGVFDAWIQGDAQTFAEMLRAEIERAAKAKEVASEKKRRKEEEAAKGEKDELPDLARLQEKDREKSAKPSKRKSGAGAFQNHEQISSHQDFRTPTTTKTPSQASKRRKMVVGPPSPPYTPPSPPHRASPEPIEDEDHENHPLNSKLYFRLPPIHRHHEHRTYIVPEVYITSRPTSLQTRSPQFIRPKLNFRMRTPSPPRAQSSLSSMDYSRPSPSPPPSISSTSGSSSSVPLPGKPNKHTKAGRRAAKEARDARRAERLAVDKTSPGSSRDRSRPRERTYHPASQKASRTDTVVCSDRSWHGYGRDIEMDIDVDGDLLDIGMDLDAEDRMFMRRLHMDMGLQGALPQPA